MSYSPKLSSSFNDTRMRSKHIAPNGMCAFCSEECDGICEIGISAMRGEMAVYPTNTGANQVASEKIMPIDFSHFNINGRVFDAIGTKIDENEATIFNVNLEQNIDKENPIKLAMPIILPALIKLNWQDYFAAAAMAGINCVLGENASLKDPNVAYENGKIVKFEMLNEMLDTFRKYDRGYGEIILQCNTEDDAQGLPEYALAQAGVSAIEFKFGQSAKGTQPVVRINTLEEALAKVKIGGIVHPDPTDSKIQEAYAKKMCPNFFFYSKLPMWNENYLVKRAKELRELGMKNLYFKMAGYDIVDMERVMRIAAMTKATMVTFDGAGGGSGYSPCKMMNEWSYPAVLIEAALVPICRKMEAEGLEVPAIAITGGLSTEDEVYKALALGAPYVKAVGLCRSTMAAAMNGKRIGQLLEEKTSLAHIRQFGSTKEEVFACLPELRYLYGEAANDFSTGAIGAYSYLKRIAFGVQHFAALNRKFDIKYIDNSDIIALTPSARDILKGCWFE